MGVSKESYLLKVKSSKGWSSSKTLSKDENGSSGVRSKELAGDLSITLLDPRHVFIKLSNKEDMHQKTKISF